MSNHSRKQTLRPNVQKGNCDGQRQNFNFFFLVIFPSKLEKKTFDMKWKSPLRLLFFHSKELLWLYQSQMISHSFSNLWLFVYLMVILGANPCLSLQCSSNEECLINKLGVASCICPPQCEKIIRPVCGTDGHTYDSYCHLQSDACRNKRNVQLNYEGTCGK